MSAIVFSSQRKARTAAELGMSASGGASRLVGNDVGRMRAAYHAALSSARRPSRPELWDGHAAERIAAALVHQGR